MNHGFASLIVAGVAVSSGSCALTSTQSARHQDVEVEIIVNGVAQRRYAHDGRLYVEALNGQEYAVRLRNPYPVRAGVTLSVDGLNTIDARRSSAADARMWVLDPYDTVTISGWQTRRTEARGSAEASREAEPEIVVAERRIELAAQRDAANGVRVAPRSAARGAAHTVVGAGGITLR